MKKLEKLAICAVVKNEDIYISEWIAAGVRKAVGIRCGAISSNMKVSFQAARSIG